METENYIKIVLVFAIAALVAYAYVIVKGPSIAPESGWIYYLAFAGVVLVVLGYFSDSCGSLKSMAKRFGKSGK